MPTRKGLSGISLLLLIMVSCGPPAIVRERSAPIAVWELSDYSPSKATRPDLGELLAAEVTQTIQKSGAYTVIERERLMLVLEELRLGTSALADETTRLRLGKMAGARWMVFGGYQLIGGTMRLDLRLVEVESGKIRRAVQKVTSGTDLQGWLNAARKAAEELI